MSENAGRFVKGDPRINRKGHAKKGETLAEMFRNAMNEAKSESNPDYTKLHAMIDKVLQKALAGDQQALEYAFARGFGKLIDRIETNNTNKNYDFSNLSLEDRLRLLEAIKSANTTVSSDSPDSL